MEENKNGSDASSEPGGALVNARTDVLDLKDEVIRCKVVNHFRVEDELLGNSIGNQEGSGKNVLAQVDLHLCSLHTQAFNSGGEASFEALTNNSKQLIVHVDCSLNYLSKVPPIGAAAYSVRSLDLSINQIASLESTNLKLPCLRALNLSRNAINRVSQKTFSSLGSLVELNLSSNHIESTESIINLPNLESLILRRNHIAILTGISGMPRLSHLNLSYNIIEDAIKCSELLALQSLDLSNNRLDDLDEMRDVLQLLGNVEHVRLAGNPLTKCRNYRMRILENKLIKKLDNFRVSDGARKDWHAQCVQLSLDEIVEKTTSQYMRWIEKEAKEKADAIAILRRREEAIERSFDEYRATMEAELDQTISYIQETANNSKNGMEIRSFLSTASGQEEWHDFIKHMEDVRKQTYLEERHKLEAKLEDAISLKSDTDNYIEKVHVISQKRPSAWREIKHKELEFRKAEESREESEQEEIKREHENARERLVQRAEQRNQLLLATADRLDVTLRLGQNK